MNAKGHVFFDGVTSRISGDDAQAVAAQELCWKVVRVHAKAKNAEGRPRQVQRELIGAELEARDVGRRHYRARPRCGPLDVERVESHGEDARGRGVAPENR